MISESLVQSRSAHTSLPQDQQQEGGGDVEDPADGKVKQFIPSASIN